MKLNGQRFFGSARAMPRTEASIMKKSKSLVSIAALVLSSFVASTPAIATATCDVTVFTDGTGAGTLRNCLSTISADGTITFTTASDSVITADSALVLPVDGVTIDGAGEVTIKRGTGTDHPLMELTGTPASEETTTLRGLVFDGRKLVSGTETNVDVDGVAGAVYASQANTKLVVDSSSFISNRLTNGSSGGAINMAGNIEVTDSVFTNNVSDSAGGAIYTSGTLTITNSTFTGNQASNDGGAVYSGGDASVIGSTFIANKTTRSDSDDELGGGAVHSNSTASISGTSVFNRNESGDEGGAIFARILSTSGTTSFISNVAGNDGGAVYTIDDANVSGNALFDSNVSGDDGGAVYSQDNVGVTNASFLNNSASDDGGAVYASAPGLVDAESSVFFGNEAAGDGGAIRSTGGTVFNSTFFDNESAGFGGGVFIFEDGGTKYFAYNTFVNNVADSGTASAGQSIALNRFEGENADVTLFANLFINSGSVAQLVGVNGFSGTPTDLGANVSTGADAFLNSSTSKVSVDYSTLHMGVPSTPTLTLRPFVPFSSLSSTEVEVTQALATNFETVTSKTLPTVDQQGTARTFGTTGYMPGAQFISTSTNTAFASTSDTLVATMYEIEDRSFYITDDDKTVTGDEYFYRLSTSDGTLVDLSSSAGMTGPLTEADQDFYYVNKLNYAANAYDWEWMVFFCEAANEITDSIPTITYSKQESSPAATNASYDSNWSFEYWSAPQGTLETFQFIDLPAGYSPTSSKAFTFLTLADASDDQRMTISKQTATAVCPSGENAYVENLKVAGSEVSARSLDLSQDFQVNVGGLDQDIDLVGRSVAVYGVSGPSYIPAAAHFGITTIVQGQAVSETPAPYSGPVVTQVGSSAGAFQAVGGQNVTVSGERLSTVSKVFVDGLEGEVISTSADSFVMTVPEGLSAGTYDLVIESSLGNLTYLDALVITASVGTTCTLESMSYWTTRISDTQAKVYVKCPELDAKIRILHQTGGSGEYDVPFVKTITSRDDTSLVVNEFGTYIVRTIELEEINRIRIRIDDQEVWKVRYNR